MKDQRTPPLPASWERTTLGNVCEINPRRFSVPVRDGSELSFVPMKSVEEETGRLNASKTTQWSKVRNGYTPFQDGDVIFAKITPCMENGKFAVASGLKNGIAVGSTEFHVLRPSPRITAKYLLHYLFMDTFRRSARANMKGTAGQLRVPAEFLRNAPISLPSVEEQETIVAEMENRFSRLSAGVEALHRIQEKLKKYRAAVLKAACEGRLVPTEAELAKKEGRPYETGAQLLDRILTAQRKNWQGRGQYKEPSSPYTPDLPSLLEGWAWATVGQLAAPEPNSITDGPFGSNLKTTHYRDTGPRVIRLQNIGDGIYIDEEAHIAQEHFERLQRHRVFENDVVIAGFGENPPRSCVIPKTLGPAIVKADCIRFKPHTSVRPRYINIALNSDPVRKRTKGMVHGVGRPRLNLGEIKSIILPLPPLAEQTRIVVEVERRLSMVDALETLIEASLHRAAGLRQSILKKVFLGGMVQ